MPLQPFEDSVLLISRIILGIVMLYYGRPKLKNLKANGADFVKMGFKPGIFWGTIVAIVEFFGGIAVIIGFAVSLAAALFAFEMLLGTIWKISKAHKPFTNYSYDLVLFTLCLMLLTFGSGFYTISRLF